MATAASRVKMTTNEPKPFPPEDVDPPAKGDDVSASTGQGRWADQDEDVRLMLAFQRGDESAFTELVGRTQARVYAVVQRFMAGRSDAEDIVQEVFLRVFRSAHRYTPTARFSTWLYRIAANLCINAIRKASKFKTIPLRPHLDGQDEGGPAEITDVDAVRPDEDMQQRELAETIRTAIEQLPDNQRVAVILHRYEHMSYLQIAEVLDCSAMAVKSLMSRARENLKELLADHLEP
jgi:RNA polymerase sigma-70 factor (ECF subfamily)